MSTRENETTSGEVALFALVMLPVMYASYGHALHLMWGWVCVPLFGAPSITAAQFVVLIAIKGLFWGDKQAKKFDAGDVIVYAIVLPWFTVSVAWVALRLM